MASKGSPGERPRGIKKLRENIELFKRDWMRTVAEVRLVDGKERLVSRNNNVPLELDDASKEEGYVAQGRGSMFVFERERGKKMKWHAETIDSLGKSGTLAAEQRALAYEVGCDPIFPKPVRDEEAKIRENDRLAAEKHGVEVGQGLIAEEVAKGFVSAGEGDWQTKYKHGENRVDFRGVKTIGIDPRTAKDHDDIISYRELGDGTVEIGVHIADVSHFVPYGSEIQKEAWRRQFTAYFQGLTSPMLPPVLSEELCSLKPGKDRLAFSTVFKMDAKTGAVIGKPWIGRTIVRSDKQYAYEDADKIALKTNATGEEKDEQNLMLKLQKYAKVFRDAKARRGELRLFDNNQELEVVRDDTGKVISTGPKARGEMSRVIEDFMVAANEAGGDFMVEGSKKSSDGTPFILREHEPPSFDELTEIAKDFNATIMVAGKRTSMAQFIRDHRSEKSYDGMPLPNFIISKLLEFGSRPLSKARVKAIREDVANNPANSLRDPDPQRQEQNIKDHIAFLRAEQSGPVLDAILRRLNKATFTTEDKPHTGLAAERYAWLTSPIRRYSDILGQYLISTMLNPKRAMSKWNAASAGEVQSTANRGTERDKQVDSASKLSVRQFAADLLGNESLGSTIDVYIQRIEQGKTTRSGEVLPPRAHISVSLPHGRYPITFPLPLGNIEELPQSVRDAEQGHKARMQLLGFDVKNGTLFLKYVGEAPDGDSEPDDEEGGGIVGGNMATVEGGTTAPMDVIDPDDPRVKRALEGLKSTDWRDLKVLKVYPDGWVTFEGTKSDVGGVEKRIFTWRPHPDPTYPGLVQLGERPDDAADTGAPPVEVAAPDESEDDGDDEAGKESVVLTVAEKRAQMLEKLKKHDVGDRHGYFLARTHRSKDIKQLEKLERELDRTPLRPDVAADVTPVEPEPRPTGPAGGTLADATTTATDTRPDAAAIAAAAAAARRPTTEVLPTAATEPDRRWFWQRWFGGRREAPRPAPAAVVTAGTAPAEPAATIPVTERGTIPLGFVPRNREELYALADERAKWASRQELHRAERALALREARGVVLSEAGKVESMNMMARTAEQWKKIPLWKKLGVSIGILGAGAVATAFAPATAITSLAWASAITWRLVSAAATGAVMGATTQKYLDRRNYKHAGLIGALTAGVTTIGTLVAGQKLAEIYSNWMAGRPLLGGPATTVAEVVTDKPPKPTLADKLPDDPVKVEEREGDSVWGTIDPRWVKPDDIVPLPVEILPGDVVPEPTYMEVRLPRGSSVWSVFAEGLGGTDLGLTTQQTQSTTLAFIEAVQGGAGKPNFKELLLGEDFAGRAWSRIPGDTLLNFGELLDDPDFVERFTEVLESDRFRSLRGVIEVAGGPQAFIEKIRDEYIQRS